MEDSQSEFGTDMFYQCGALSFRREWTARTNAERALFDQHEQYALRERAVALGWAIEQVVVIDSDLGQSGASSTDRGQLRIHILRCACTSPVPKPNRSSRSRQN